MVLCLSIHFLECIYGAILFHSNNLCTIIIELFDMRRDVGDAGKVQIWGYPTPTTKWCLALKKEENGSVNKFPKFIPEDVIGVSE